MAKTSSGARASRYGTSYDVAREAGVSQSTVSRVFRDAASVAPATRLRVLEAAARVGYRPNAIAASLITRRSHLVAVVISNLTNLHYPEVLAELTRRLSARGLRVLLFTLSTESEIDQVLEQIWRYRVDGAIVAARLSAGQEAEFAREGVPLVLYNRASAGGLASVVCCDFAEGERVLVERLLAAGRRAFGLVAGPADSAVGEARIAGAVRCLAAAGLAPLGIARGDFSHASGMQATEALAGRHRLDAVVAANDVMALGAIDALRGTLGLRVPEEVAVVGFDGVAPAAWPPYRLTTVRQPVERMAQAAVDLLLARIEAPDAPPEAQRFAGELVEGATAPLA